VLSGEERRSRRESIVTRLYNEGWARGDFAVVFELLDPAVVWSAIEGAPDAGTYRGFESVRAYMEDWLDNFDFERGGGSIEESVEVGDRLVCVQRVVGIGRGSEVPTEIRYACIYTFGTDELIVEVNEYATRDEALKAASAKPPQPAVAHTRSRARA
jgi:ketosteroid isomerase-like protein